MKRLETELTEVQRQYLQVARERQQVQAAAQDYEVRIAQAMRRNERHVLDAKNADAFLAGLDTYNTYANDWLERLEGAKPRATKPRRAITTHNLPRMTRHYRWAM